MLGRRLFGCRHRDQLNLHELVLTDHAAGILAGRPGLGPKRRGTGGKPQWQVALVENLVGDEIGQRHLGGRDQPQAVGRAEHVFSRFRQLPRAEHRLVAHQQWRRHLDIAEFLSMQIEHELGEPPLQPRQILPQHHKPRSGEPSGAAKIHQSKTLAEHLMRSRLEIKQWRLALAAHQQVGPFVRAVRHFLGRQIRQSGQDLIDLRTQPRRFGRGIGLGVLVFGHLAQQGLDVLAALFGGADIAGDAIAPRLRLLRARLRRAPSMVQREHLRGTRRKAAAGEAAVELRRMLADPSDIVHRSTKTQTEHSRYRRRATTRPFGSRRAGPTPSKSTASGRHRTHDAVYLTSNMPYQIFTHRIEVGRGRKRCWD